MRSLDTIKLAKQQGRDPYKAVACEWDRCEPDEVTDKRRKEVKDMVYCRLFGTPEYKKLKSRENCTEALSERYKWTLANGTLHCIPSKAKENNDN